MFENKDQRRSGRLAWNYCTDVWPSCRPLSGAISLSSERFYFRTVSSQVCCLTPERTTLSGLWDSWTPIWPIRLVNVRQPAAALTCRLVLPSNTTSCRVPRRRSPEPSSAAATRPRRCRRAAAVVMWSTAFGCLGPRRLRPMAASWRPT